MKLRLLLALGTVCTRVEAFGANPGSAPSTNEEYVSLYYPTSDTTCSGAPTSAYRGYFGGACIPVPEVLRKTFSLPPGFASGFKMHGASARGCSCTSVACCNAILSQEYTVEGCDPDFTSKMHGLCVSTGYVGYQRTLSMAMYLAEDSSHSETDFTFTS